MTRQPTPDVLGQVLGPVDDTRLMRSQLRYDYDQLGAVGPAVQEHAVAIKSHERKANEAVIEAGRHLIAVKESLQHGQWEDWLRVEFAMTDRTARTMMTIAERFDGKTEKISVLGTSVLGLLASPSVPDTVVEKVIDVAATEGKVSVTRAKQIIQHQKFLDKKDTRPQPEQPRYAEDDRTAERDALPTKGWANWGWAAVWELEQEVCQAHAEFYREENELRNAASDMRAAARTGAGGFWALLVEQLGVRPWRKQDLAQALHNVASQMEQKQRQPPAGRPMMEVIQTDEEIAEAAQAADIASRNAAADEAERQARETQHQAAVLTPDREARAVATADAAFGMAQPPSRNERIDGLLHVFQRAVDALPEVGELTGHYTTTTALRRGINKVMQVLKDNKIGGYKANE